VAECAEWWVGSLPSSSSPSSSASASSSSRPEELKGPISLAPTECFIAVAPHVQMIWKEGGGKKKSSDQFPNRDAAHFFSVCFARRTAYVTLWNIMLQMPANQPNTKNCKEGSW
jgi:hypothetical protein